MKTSIAPRAIHKIAADIRKEWINVNYAAAPYLNAMSDLLDRTSSYGADTADHIILYFLSNASSFRGPRAKELKAELKLHLK